jgi:uncharacterized surface protein with fasciclin (FAS1) repeats
MTTVRTLAAAAIALTIASGTEAQQKDIVDTVADAGSFKTLIAAVRAAGLESVLRGEGPFTVFAPTDAAFAKLPAGTIEALLADPAKLKSILTYHVVAGRVMGSDVLKLSEAMTVNGETVAIAVADGVVKIDNARVTQTDIRTSNGVIHVIDTVILPGTN